MATANQSMLHKSVFGNMRVHIMSITADATVTAAIDTGLSYVYGYALAPQTMVTAAISLFPNKGALGTARAGYIGASAMVDGDVFQLVVFGR